MEKNEINVNSEMEGMRLDRYLRKNFKDEPLSRIFGAIRAGDVKVNGKKSKENYRLALNDTIVIKNLFSENFDNKKSFEKNNILNTLCFSENTIKWFESKKIDIKICGTGDVFSSLVTSELVKGEKLENSIQKIQTLLFENIIKQEKQDGLNEIQLENFKIGK